MTTRTTGFEVYPFKHLDHGKYDLNACNEQVWARFQGKRRETTRGNIFVQIGIRERFDYADLDDSNRRHIYVTVTPALGHPRRPPGVLGHQEIKPQFFLPPVG